MKQVLAILPLFLAAVTSSLGAARAQSDMTAPIATVDTPRNGAAYTQAQLSGALIAGRARDNMGGSGVASVTIVLSRQAGGVTRFYDGRGFNLASAKYLLTALSGAGDIKAWSIRLPTIAAGLLPGTYRVQALARDRRGNAGSSLVTAFAVRAAAPPPTPPPTPPPGDRIAPTVSFVLPSNGATYSATTTRFGALGNVADNAGGVGVASVSVIAYRYADSNGPAGYFNGQTFTSRTPIENLARVPRTVGNQQTQWLLDPYPAVFTPGRILLRVIARDKAGNASAASLTFTRA